MDSAEIPDPAEPLLKLKPVLTPLKLTATSGAVVVFPAVYPGAVVPSINTLFTIAGKSLARVITPATENVIPEYCVEGALLTEVIAVRNDPAPESLKVLTT